MLVPQHLTGLGPLLSEVCYLLYDCVLTAGVVWNRVRYCNVNENNELVGMQEETVVTCYKLLYLYSLGGPENSHET
jgi:hypothetical protein